MPEAIFDFPAINARLNRRESVCKVEETVTPAIVETVNGWIITSITSPAGCATTLTQDQLPYHTHLTTYPAIYDPVLDCMVPDFGARTYF